MSNFLAAFFLYEHARRGGSFLIEGYFLPNFQIVYCSNNISMLRTPRLENMICVSGRKRDTHYPWCRFPGLWAIRDFIGYACHRQVSIVDSKIPIAIATQCFFIGKVFILVFF